jgi:glutamine synthetase
VRPGPGAHVGRGTRAQQGQALDELEKDEVLLAAMGDLRARGYLGVRRSEAAAFAAEDEAFEIRSHFYRF